MDSETKTLFTFTGKETDLESHLIDNLSDISLSCGWGEVSTFKRQYTIPMSKGRIRLDLMLWHPDGTGTAIECKTGNTNRNDLLTGMSQLLFYGVVLEFSLKHLPRLVLATPTFSQIVQSTIQRFALPINLLTVDGDRCVYKTF